MSTGNRYSRLIEKIFRDKYKRGLTRVEFLRSDIEKAAKYLNIALPKNLGDVIYSFRFRISLPDYLIRLAGPDKEWLIKLSGRGSYCFCLEDKLVIAPNKNLVITKILDSTPGAIVKYALTDEQALLAILRYNRLIDTFLGITCYSLQNHLRTTVPDFGQVETDEIYVGVDKRGAHYVVPVQAKGGNDKQGKVQIEQDFALCAHKFPKMICIPIAAQFMSDDKIALFAFEQDSDGISISSERHYKLVSENDISDLELEKYAKRK